ncbi:hypothetical protein KDI_12010 [Dictyobacter arantiisoli]|uniref:Uncharacterized protein n=1 Tax=Dictyobacter arantiisoli TaxID=2014874 RepID=A0A5A5T8F8_9CHLR|nr:hypothetical protein KDI_12010 [Dictyobacter arantiisoli]
MPVLPTQPTATAIPPTVPTVNPGGIIPPVLAPDITPTAQANPTKTPTPTPSPTPDASTPTATVTAGGAITNQAPTSTDQNSNGMSNLIVPVVVGVGLAAVIGVVLGIYFLKKQKAPVRRPLSARAYGRTGTGVATPGMQPTPWLNQQQITAGPGLDTPNYAQIAANEATLAATAIPMPTGRQRAITPMSSAPFTGSQPIIAMPAERQQNITSMSSAPFTGPQQAIPMPTSRQQSPTPALPPLPNTPGTPYSPAQADKNHVPSDTQPTAISLASQGASPAQINPISTSDMNPLLLDSFDLSHILPQQNQQDVTTRPDLAQPAINASAFSPLLAPNIQDDPVLETIMRQAQMGLYAISDKDPANANDTQEDAFLS